MEKLNNEIGNPVRADARLVLGFLCIGEEHQLKRMIVKAAPVDPPPVNIAVAIRPKN